MIAVVATCCRPFTCKTRLIRDDFCWHLPSLSSCSSSASSTSYAVLLSPLLSCATCWEVLHMQGTHRSFPRPLPVARMLCSIFLSLINLLYFNSSSRLLPPPPPPPPPPRPPSSPVTRRSVSTKLSHENGIVMHQQLPTLHVHTPLSLLPSLPPFLPL